MSINYPGWELKYFDKALNFRKYQFLLTKKYIYGHVAEIGPGGGANLNIYKSLAKSIDLFEPSKKIFSKLSKYKNNKIKIFNKIFINSKKKYDTILYLDVIEHIKKDKQEIFNAYHYLKKNGHLIISVPAFQYLYSKFDRDVYHFKRYSKKEFKNILFLLNINNFKLIYFDSLGYVLSLFSKIFTRNYKKYFALKIFIWDKLIPLSILFDNLIFNFFGKSLLVVIKKE
jgi:hypothetical protein